jgi:hypothetical protein
MLLAAFASWLLVAGAVFAQTAGPANADCQTCHAEPSMTRADGRPVVVDPAAFEASVHGSFGCIDCHADLAGTELPHPEKLAPVMCSTCHDEPAAGFAKSVHAAIPASAGGPARCQSCHGPPHQIKPSSDPESATNKLRVAQTCAQCHGDTVARGAPTGAPAVAGAFADSIHGQALTRTGLVVAPTCSDCHRSHEIVSPDSPDSPVFSRNVPMTCGGCHAGIHQEYAQSVHASMLASGAPDAPHCASCHTAHQIGPTRNEGFQLAAVEECGTCHREALTTYRDTFHGQVTALGFTPVAKCTDCHDNHRIVRVGDAASPVSPQNRLNTCRTCHPSATENFARYEPHANRDDRERMPVLYYTSRAMHGLLFGVFAFFGLHTLLWFQRERFGPKDGAERKRE